MMTTLTQQYVDSYFETLNPLAKKICQEQKTVINSVGEDGWNKLNGEEQDVILDKYFIGEDTKTEKDDIRSSFPRLIIHCGEKIVVDFDNDQGWTWRDEHSAPFSWETRSQQDLPLYDEEDEGLGTEEAKSKKPKKPPKKARSQSPEAHNDSPINFAYKPEKSIWESPFLAADRGLDSGYPSSQTSEEQSKGPDEPEDMLNKMGIALSFKSESEPGSPNMVANEETKLLKMQRVNDTPSPQPTPALPPRKKKPPKEAPPPPPCRPKKMQNNVGPEAVSATDNIANKVSSEGADNAVKGQVSPVFVEDPGESSTDPLPPPPPPSRFDLANDTPFSLEVGATAGQVNLAMDNSQDNPVSLLDDWETPDILSKSTDQGEDDVTEADETTALTAAIMDDLSISKTGFDFLDDW